MDGTPGRHVGICPHPSLATADGSPVQHIARPPFRSSPAAAVAVLQSLPLEVQTKGLKLPKHPPHPCRLTGSCATAAVHHHGGADDEAP